MIKEFVYFTKQERRHLYIVLVIMLGFLILVIPQHKSSDREAQFTFLEAIEKRNREEKQAKKKTVPLQLNTFDPNKVTEAQLIKMGLPKQGIKSLLKYRKLGGVIKDQKHFKKMYGFEKLDDKLLTKYLLFSSQKVQSPLFGREETLDTIATPKRFFKEPISQGTTAVSAPLRKSVSININTTDTTELKTLYGIGSFRAKRIINFRNALGGFHDINQLYDTRHVPDSIITKHINKFVIDTLSIYKIKINEATTEDLARHPYISWQTAKVIFNYKKEHGHFSHPYVLYNLHGLDSTSILQMLPYLDTTND